MQLLKEESAERCIPQTRSRQDVSSRLSVFDFKGTIVLLLSYLSLELRVVPYWWRTSWSFAYFHHLRCNIHSRTESWHVLFTSPNSSPVTFVPSWYEYQHTLSQTRSVHAPIRGHSNFISGIAPSKCQIYHQDFLPLSIGGLSLHGILLGLSR